MFTLDSLFDYVVFASYLPSFLIYFAITLPFFLFFWVWYKKEWQPRRIQQKERSNRSLRWQEIRYSMLSILIFGIVDLGVYIAQANGLTLLYTNISQYGNAYLVFSIFLMIILQDTYFYWAHRLMHWKPLYRFVHKIHHNSIDPYPFTAYSFHPVEAFFETLPTAIFAFSFPVHLWALLGFEFASIFMNVIGHLGYEIIPKSWDTHWLGQWKTASTHHNMHHSKVNGNYGLYFRFWDVWMGTEFEDYSKTFHTVHGRASVHDLSKPTI